MFGYIATGSSRNAASPAITMNAETTVANNGRSMKKFEITARCPARYSVLVPAAIGTALTGAPGTTLSVPSTTTRSPAVSPAVTATSLPASAPSSTGAGADLPAAADDPDVRALRAVHDGAFRNHERARQC